MYEGLTEKGMRIWQFLEKGVREGLSFNRIIRIAREQGISYRRADMLHDLRIISKAVGKTDWQQRAPMNRVVDEEFVIRAHNPTVRKFVVTFEVKFRDEMTSETYTKHLSVTSDGYHTLNWYRDKLIHAVSTDETMSQYNNVIVGVKVAKAVGWW